MASESSLVVSWVDELRLCGSSTVEWADAYRVEATYEEVLMLWQEVLVVDHQ